MQYKIVQKKIVAVLIISIIGLSVLGFVSMGNMDHSSNSQICPLANLIGEKCFSGNNVFTFLKQHISGLQYFIFYTIELKLILLFFALLFSFFIVSFLYVFQNIGALKIMYYFKRMKFRPIENILRDIYLLKYISLNKKAYIRPFLRWAQDST